MLRARGGPRGAWRGRFPVGLKRIQDPMVAWRKSRITKVPSILTDNRVPSGNLSGWRPAHKKRGGDVSHRQCQRKMLPATVRAARGSFVLQDENQGWGIVTGPKIHWNFVGTSYQRGPVATCAWCPSAFSGGEPETHIRKIARRTTRRST